MSTDAPPQPLTASHWPADPRPDLFVGTVGDLLRRATQAAPNRLAIIEGVTDPGARRTWTYAELSGAAEAGARVLLQHFPPGTRLAVWGANSPEWLLLQQSAALAGMVLVTINPAYRYGELEYVLRNSKAAAMFHADQHRGNNLAAGAARALDEIDSLTQIWPLAAWTEFAAQADPATQLPVVEPESIAMVQYTSGTTGAPKGVLIRHVGMVNSARFVALRAGAEEGCVYLNPMPTFHIGSCGTVTLGTISRIGTQIIAERFEPGLALELIETFGASIMLGVPTMLIAMMEHPDLDRRNLSSMATVMTGGALAPAELVRRIKDRLGVRFSITFGQTETSGPSTQTDPGGSVWEQAETIGRALPHTEVKIVDPVGGAVVPVGVQGEICTRGPMTMAGYLPALDGTGLDGTGIVSGGGLQADGWLHYGDLGSMDADGYLRITGRLKDMIIRGGENISPREIEEVLFLHPAVGDAAVIGIPDPKWGERVAAVIRVLPGQRPTDEELAAHCRERLAPQKIPVTWQLVEEFPLTPSGKVQKFKLRAALTAEPPENEPKETYA